MRNEIQESQAATHSCVVDRVIRLKELLRLIALSRATVYDRLNPKSKRFDPSFPRPIKLGAASVGWSLNEVMAWIAGKRPAKAVLTGETGYSAGRATRQGSSSLTRFTGQSAITFSTCRR